MVTNPTIGLTVQIDESRSNLLGPGISVSTPVISGRFISGPIGKIYRSPVDDSIYNFCTSTEEFFEKYGDMPNIEPTAWLDARTVLDEGKNVIINRLGSYGDISNKATLVEQKAYFEAEDEGLVASVKFEAAWEGADGNNYSIDITPTNKVSTTLAAVATTGDAKITLTSISLVEKGEIIQIEERATVEYVKVIEVFRGTKQVQLETPLVNSFTTAATAKSENFSVDIYYKGELVDVVEDLSLEADNYSEFVENVFSNRNDIKATLLATASTTYPDRRIGSYTNEFLTGGVDSSSITKDDYIGNEAARTGVWAMKGFSSPLLFLMPSETVNFTSIDDWADVRDAYINFCETTTVHYFEYAWPKNTVHTDAITSDITVHTAQASSIYGNFVMRHPDLPSYKYTTYPLAKHALRYQVTDSTPATGGLPNGPWQPSAGPVYGALSVKNIVGMESIDYPAETLIPNEDEELLEELYKKRINAVARAGSSYFVRGSSLSFKGKEETFPYTEASHFRMIQDVLLKTMPVMSRFESLNHYSSTESQATSDITTIMDAYPVSALNRDETRGYLIICNATNNKRRPGTNRLLNPKELVLDIILDLGDPIKRIKLRVKRLV